MADRHSDAQGAEAPLDPAAERLRRKLTWLLAGSLGVMILGLIAVFSAIVYRVTADPAPPAEPRAAAPPVPIALPDGARVVFADLDGNRLLVRVELADGATRLLVIDARNGALQANVELRPGG